MIRLFSLADEKYYRYIKALVASASIYFPDAYFNIYLVNMKDKYLKELESINSKCTVIIEKKIFDNDHKKRCYCASRRGYLFIELRNKYPNDHLVWVDADSVFMKNADSFKKHILSCDVSMRPKDLLKGKFTSAVIVSGPKSIEFFKTYSRYINDHKEEYNWYNDQHMLNKTYVELKDKINFKPLPKIFCDAWHSDEGVLWMTKGVATGSKKRDYTKYLKEVEKWINYKK